MKSILILSDWYIPGYKAGGPIRSCSAFVDKFRNNFKISIVTSDRDLGENIPYKNITSDKWINLYTDTKIIYLSKGRANFRSIKQIISYETYDFIYLNSMYSYYFSILPLILVLLSGNFKKIVLAPRGMLSKGSLSIKFWKKKLFISLFRFLRLHSKIIFHATNIKEKHDIERVFGFMTKIVQINNIIDKPSEKAIKNKEEKSIINMVSVTRVSPVKNILYLLELIKNSHCEIKLSIYGSTNDISYYNKCLSYLNNNGLKDRVSFQEEVPHKEIKSILARAHFFILPSLGENFGYAIYESMASGTPVIISDKTPWRELEERKAGWDIPLEQKNNFVEVINKCAAMDQEEYNEWSLGAYNYAKEYYEKNDPTRAYLELFS